MAQALFPPNLGTCRFRCTFACAQPFETCLAQNAPLVQAGALKIGIGVLIASKMERLL